MSLSGHSHSFDTGIAKELGLHCAIVYNHIIYWLRINAAKDQGIVNGKVWMYETQEQIAQFLDYLSINEVKKAIVKLLESGLLIKENFNKNSFDKTNWYTVSDQNIIQKSFTKAPCGAIESAVGRDPERPTAPCIYDKEDKQVNKQQHSKAAKAAVVVPSDEEKREQKADEAATQYIKSELAKGNKVNETRIRRRFLKEGWKPNNDLSKDDLIKSFKKGYIYQGKGGGFEFFKDDLGVGFLSVDFYAPQPYTLLFASNTFKRDFEKLLERLQIKRP